MSFLIPLTLFILAPHAYPMPRDPKTLAYFDYLPEDYDITMAVENDISRTIPKGKPIYNSPIYYIRLPPQPYVYVPGLGYVSQPPPPPPPVSPFVSLPLSFVANGKPSTIYQWDSDGFEEPTPTKRPVDSMVHKLDGQFTFNGKPDKISVLRDSYNALYGDALQNFYP
ncbi:hypothetical protein TcasGA2_TC006381 [Tribolium castaneum]|uniref:Uncharacterized protein n=1 Tax=Tribolium castaneum TaxID=7070 RepID=D6WWF6_TRICA|nr:PREDICTED: uncharacterized protein LOC103313950 [Tribolium castaneum]XP_008196792.1 PREDICTED: uncharacterized protein LOC103313950 [Tribolium castaneum]EFA08710.1 hypothetical protein TcasGA2_TC006381 [Tribolium castaneum]|eukprot:XP_008196791.1 PREDICTED: uncharacterized protein LOC103313950 [Tribolium castaneum]